MEWDYAEYMQYFLDNRAKQAAENEDYYIDENGYLVMTEQFLKKRGFCCQNGCRYCPYPKVEKIDESSEK